MRYITIMIALLMGCSTSTVTYDTDGSVPDVDGGSCSPGFDGCPCAPGDLCLSDLVCSAGICSAPDAGTTPDSGMPDSTVADSGVADSASADTGLVDSGVADTGIADTGTVADSGATPDSGPADAGIDAAMPPDTTLPVQLALGDTHSCLLRTSGKVHCWGNPNLAALEPMDLNAVSISADEGTTCAVDAAGLVTCWDGYVRSPAVPPVTKATPNCGIQRSSIVSCWNDPPPPPVFMSDIDGYHGNTCGVSASTINTGEIMCWGSLPSPARGLPGYDTVSVGDNFGCAIYGTSLVCWGDNNFGQLSGPATGFYPNLGTAGRLASDPVYVHWTHVTTGRAHVCGIREDQTVWCWGDNRFGQLGHPNNPTTTLGTSDYLPAKVTLLGSPIHAVEVEAGRDHTCAILTDNRIICWGSNSRGQLGKWVDGLMTIMPVEPESFWTE